MFSDTEVDAIISRYKQREAELGRYPLPTALAVQISQAIIELIEPLELIDGRAAADDELGHVAFTVFHAQTKNDRNEIKLDNAIIVAFSGGAPSQQNFDKIAAVVKPAAIFGKIDPAIIEGEIAFRFVYGMSPNSKAESSCAEPKAVVVAEQLNATLLGVVVRWHTSSQLSTYHRLDVPFVSARDSFMLPCELCIDFFADSRAWPHVHFLEHA